MKIYHKFAMLIAFFVLCATKLQAECEGGHVLGKKSAKIGMNTHRLVSFDKKEKKIKWCNKDTKELIASQDFSTIKFDAIKPGEPEKKSLGVLSSKKRPHLSIPLDGVYRDRDVLVLFECYKAYCSKLKDFKKEVDEYRASIAKLKKNMKDLRGSTRAVGKLKSSLSKAKSRKIALGQHLKIGLEHEATKGNSGIKIVRCKIGKETDCAENKASRASPSTALITETQAKINGTPYYKIEQDGVDNTERLSYVESISGAFAVGSSITDPDGAEFERFRKAQKVFFNVVYDLTKHITGRKLTSFAKIITEYNKRINQMGLRNYVLKSPHVKDNLAYYVYRRTLKPVSTNPFTQVNFGLPISALAEFDKTDYNSTTKVVDNMRDLVSKEPLADPHNLTQNMTVIRKLSHELVSTKILSYDQTLKTMPSTQVKTLKGVVFAWLWESLGQARDNCMDESKFVAETCMGSNAIADLCHAHKKGAFAEMKYNLPAGSKKVPARSTLEDKLKGGTKFFTTMGGNRKNSRAVLIKACVNDMARVAIEPKYHDSLKKWWANRGKSHDLPGLIARLPRLNRSYTDDAASLSANVENWAGARQNWRRVACPNWFFSAINNEPYNLGKHRGLGDQALKGFFAEHITKHGNSVFSFSSGSACVIAVEGVKLPIEKIGNTGEHAVVLETRGWVPDYTILAPKYNADQWKQILKRWRKLMGAD